MQTQFVQRVNNGTFRTYHRKGFSTLRAAKVALGITRWRHVQTLPGGFLIFAE